MNGVESAAEFSPCGRYRYSLTRIWDHGKPTVCVIGLNPSTADAIRDDPTIRRCVRFARDWRFGRLVVVNLFAFRSTDPRVLRRVDDPVGPRNDEAIRQACETAQRVVVAWGIHGRMAGRGMQVLSQISRPYCLGMTLDGLPKHPLYLAGTTRMRRYPALPAANCIANVKKS